jgi:type III secretion protein L
MASRVIKRGEVSGDISPDTGFADQAAGAKSSKVISGEAFVAKSEAKTIRERAQEEVGQIVSDAHAEAERIKQQAYEEAKAQGYKDGRNEGAQELAATVARASQRLKQIEAQAVPQLKELALAIARKILGKELEFHPEAVVDIVKQALSEKARQRREIFLRVNPEDLQLLREKKADLIEVLSRCKEIGIREDPEVERYGCIIETDAGIIDAQLETQIAVFERILKDG